MFIGAVFPHAFIMPPRKTGTYVTSTSVNTGEVWGKFLSATIGQREHPILLNNDGPGRKRETKEIHSVLTLTMWKARYAKGLTISK